MADLLVVWLIGPAVLLALGLGTGSLAAVALARRWDAVDAVTVGFGLVLVASSGWIVHSGHADLTPAFISAIAIIGVLAAVVVFGAKPYVDWWAACAGVAAYLAYALPTLASGTPTWAGWIKLDDGATFLAMTDRILDAGKSGIPRPGSTFDLVANPVTSYPTGSLPPIGIVSSLTGVDSAWFVQPYMAMMGGLIGLLLYRALGDTISKPPVRAFAAAIAAQASLLVAYTLWGGIKEVVIGFVLLLAARGIASIPNGPQARQEGALAAMTAAAALLLIGGSSTAGYLFALAGSAAIVCLWQVGRRGKILAGAVTCLGAATVATVAATAWEGPLARFVPRIPNIGNLVGPLPMRQMFGIWFNRDFRFPTEHPMIVTLLMILVVILAAIGIVQAVRRNAWTLPVFLAVTFSAAFVSDTFVGAWLAGKALAVASPAWIAMALFGAGAVASYARGTGYRRLAMPVGVGMGILVVCGVVWSNALAYNGVWLAPRGPLVELENIGKTFPGEGPTLFVDYNVYGSRHFLRRQSPEAISEWRTRQIPLRDGSLVGKGGSADVDAVDLVAIQEFSTLVLRRGPFSSRPPYPYVPVWQGTDYEVWRLEPARGTAVSGISLGGGGASVGVPDCAEVQQLAANAPIGAFLAVASRAPAVAVPLSAATLPLKWLPGVSPGSVLLAGSGTATVPFSVPQEGRYALWAAGSFAGRLNVAVDAKHVFSGRSVISLDMQQFSSLGSVRLTAGAHVATIDFDTPWWLPGSGAGPFLFGPLAVSADTAATAQVERVPLEKARSLCGRDLDWIQVIIPPPAT